MIYGTVRFPDVNGTATATLTDEDVWECPGVPFIEIAFNHFYQRLDTSPALGDPIFRHVHEMASIVNGTAEVVPLESPPPDTIY